jgi:aspartate-semialdehyde dehydrogenase
MINVAIVGATGIVGQQFVAALDRHPWFRISCLAASEKCTGKTYEQALRDPDTGALRWYCNPEQPNSVLHLTMQDASTLDLSEVDLIFTALDSAVARGLEPKYARSKPVVSTASAFRYEDDVPILVPGVNLEHARLIHTQRKKR